MRRRQQLVLVGRSFVQRRLVGWNATPVPEPEQMALFAMGAAVLCGRAFVVHRKNRRK